MRRLSRLIPLLLAPLFTACISYSVGTTARPVPQGEFQPSLSAYFVPNGIDTRAEEEDTDESLAYASAIFEGRWGLSDRSELSLTVPIGGAILGYKRLLTVNDPERMAVAAMGGTGIVNYGNHAYVQAGLIASGPENGRVPYGGARIMHVVPISSGAVSDTPTVGLFGGLRFDVNANFAISPELGVYYDKSALELRDTNIIVIPSITFHWD